jgi:hypothetical protein
MKISSFAILALVALETAGAFQSPPIVRSTSRPASVRSFAVDLSASTSTQDVSVPYDAAAEFAYDEWRNKYDKPFNAARYEVFKDNYKAITVMNVSAKKKARESESGDSPSLLSLNEYADCTAEEYEAAMNGGESSSSTSTGDILGEAVAAAQSQSAASSALQDAADALAEEEEVCSLVLSCFLLLFKIDVMFDIVLISI